VSQTAVASEGTICDDATPAHTGSTATRGLGIAVLTGGAALLAFGLVFSDPDVVQGDSVRLMYIHVPSAICMYLGVGALGLGSAVWLKRRTEFWDLLALAGAEIGALFTALTLLTGMLWGRPTWGVFWVWDARLTATSLLLVMLIGYLALRKLPGDATVRARRAAITGLVVVLDLPLIHYSVEWWRTLHQGATISRLDPQIDGLMLFSLMLGVVVGVVTFAWLAIHRFRLAHLEELVECRGLDVALEARRAEADRSPPPGEPPLVGTSP
jgi:heme exporter protein C